MNSTLHAAQDEHERGGSLAVRRITVLLIVLMTLSLGNETSAYLRASAPMIGRAAIDLFSHALARATQMIRSPMPSSACAAR